MMAVANTLCAHTGIKAPDYDNFLPVARSLLAKGNDSMAYDLDTYVVENNRVAPTINAAFGSKLGLDNQHIDSGAGLFVYDEQPIALAGNTIGKQPENGGNGTGFDESGSSYTLTKTDVHAVAYSFDSLSSNSMKSSNPNSGCNKVEVSKTLDTSRGLDQSCNQGGIGIATAFKIRGGCDGGGKGYLGSDESAFTLSTHTDQHLHHGMQVRRLTPTECARLQGFPDDYLSQVPGASDTSMYKALGNSMACNVMQLIGQRIQMVSEIPCQA